jgi:hypothetical protein
MSLLTRWLLLLTLALSLVWNNRALAQSGSVAAASGAKLRAAATRKSPVRALLPAGTQVEVHEAKGGYARVSAAGKKGWVAQRLLSMNATPLRRGGMKSTLSPSPARGRVAGGKGTSRGGKQSCAVLSAQARPPHRRGHGRLPSVGRK